MSSPVAISVEGLGKRYAIGRATERATTIREALTAAPVALLARVGRPRAGGAPTIWALRDVSFEQPEGQVLGVIGRNGAGKSTLLKVLSRITQPTEGRAVIRGSLSSLLEVGTGFHSELTGRENVFLNGAILGMSRAEITAKLDEIVDFAGVERFLDTPVKRYSSGMQMRLAFSVAAHLEPDVLVVDEVLAVGDAEFQRRSLGKMQDVTRQGRTVVFVSHNMGAVRTLCDRALLLGDGRLVDDGPAGRVVDRYLAMDADLTDDGSIPANAYRIGTAEAQFVRALTADLDDRPVRHLAFGAPLRVRVAIAVDEPLTDAVVEVGISSVEGFRILTALTVDGDREPLALARGEVSLSVDLEQRLLPGEYVVDVGLHRADGRTVDFVERVAGVEVTNIASDETGAVASFGRGFVQPQAIWRTARVDE